VHQLKFARKQMERAIHGHHPGDGLAVIRFAEAEGTAHRLVMQMVVCVILFTAKRVSGQIGVA
jgi:hypothetical protein